MNNTATVRLRTFLVSAALVAATAAAYWPVATYPFVNWDDNQYVYENAQVTSGLTWENLTWSWGIHGPGQWHPLAWWSHQLDCQLFGATQDAAGWHHVTNLLLHTAAALVLLGALRRLTGAFWPSAFVAALFALHPLNVEPVAWISERRDVLSALFWAATLWAYAIYAQRGGAARYVPVLVLFALGLMAKPMLITLPCVLLLLDFWPLRRVRGFSLDGHEADAETTPCPQRSARWLVAEKLPLLVLAGISAYLSYLCQQGMGVIVTLQAYPVSTRVANAVLNYVLYLRNMLWPWNLSPMHPLSKSFVISQVTGAAVLLLAITAAAVWFARRRPYLLVGWLWYLGTLVPVIGLFPMGIGLSIADRWVYLPLLGIYVAVAWSLRDLLVGGSRGRQVAAAALAILVLGASAVLTHRQVGFWSDSVALMQRALALDPDLPVAEVNLGCALRSQGHTDQAIFHFRKALRLRSDFDLAHVNLGNALDDTGQKDEAIWHYGRAVSLKPDCLEAHGNLGNLLADQGKLDEAVVHYLSVVRLNPRDVLGHSQLGHVLARQGKFQDAEVHLREVVRLDPSNANAHWTLAQALQDRGQTDEAIEHYQKSLQLKPDHTNSLNNLAWIRATHPQRKYRDGAEALTLARRAVDLSPRDASILDTLSAAYAEAGRFPEAIETAQRTLTLALKQKNTTLIEAVRARLKLYQASSPYRAKSLVPTAPGN